MKQIEWNEELEEMAREKAAAEATRGSSFLGLILPQGLMNDMQT